MQQKKPFFVTLCYLKQNIVRTSTRLHFHLEVIEVKVGYNKNANDSSIKSNLRKLNFKTLRQLVFLDVSQNKINT